MAKPPRRIWLQVFRNFLDSFKSRQSKPQLMGEDRLGNQYFETLPTAASNRVKPHRYYLPAKGEEDFEQELPSEWEAWLRGRRKRPPTPEEIAKNYEIMLMKKKNAAQLAQEKEGSKLLDSPSVPKGFDSFPKYDDLEDIPGRKLDPKKNVPKT